MNVFPAVGVTAVTDPRGATMAAGRSRPCFVSTAALIGTMVGVTSACDTESLTSSGSAEAGGPRCAAYGTAWEEPASYAYTLSSTTQTLMGTFRIEVRNGTVTKVTGLDKDSQRQAREQHVEVPTLGELSKRLQQARCDDAETAEADYAPDGHPMRISLDWDKNAIDDEALYGISSYEPHAG